MLSKLQLGGILILLSLAFAVLYTRGHAVDPVEHLQYAHAYHALRAWNTTLNQDVLRSRYGVLRSYDPLVESVQEMRSSLDDLSANSPAYLESDAARSRYEQALAESFRLLERKEQLLDRFKTVHAQVASSERYFPIVAEELLDSVRVDLAGVEAEGVVREFVEAVLLHDVSSGRDSGRDALASLQQLERLPKTRWPEATVELAALAIGHGRIIAEQKRSLEQIIERAVTLPFEAQLRILQDAEAEAYERSFRAASGFRLALYLFSLSALGGIAYLYLRMNAATLALNEANEGLEQRVEARTRELLDKNRALVETEARVSAILGGSLDAILSLDTAGTILSANDGALRMLGTGRSELIGAQVGRFLCEVDEATLDAASQAPSSEEHAAVGIGEYRELECMRADGGEFPAEVAITSARALGQTLLVCTVRDVTERKRVQRLKDEFISTVSHELRTPLTSIRGSLGLIQGGAMGEVPAEVLELVEIACRNADRLTRLINDILDLEKIESGRMEIRIAGVDVDDWLRSAIDANQGYADQCGVEFVLGSKSSGLQLEADRDRLDQVLANLLSNAAKFSTQGEEVLVEARAAGSSIRISVTDRGQGIPEEFRPRLFDKFTQAGEVSTRSVSGTGLGLSICKAMIEQMGGSIGFDTEIGKGTTFYFELPQAPRPAAEEAADPGSRRILICEDDPDIARLLAMMLEQEGYVTDRASSASEARALLGCHPYEAMTLDLGLPDQDGMSLLRDLRADPVHASLPVLVVSASSDGDRSSVNGDALEIVDWISKPIEPDRLREGVRLALRRSNGATPRILHVEDDADIASLVRRIIGELAEVQSARSLQAAAQLLQTESFDLVVLDVGLPDGNGLEMLEQIEREVPVILFSAADVETDIVSRVSASLLKSETTPEELRRTIASLLELPGQAQGQSRG